MPKITKTTKITIGDQQVRMVNIDQERIKPFCLKCNIKVTAKRQNELWVTTVDESSMPIIRKAPICPICKKSLAVPSVTGKKGEALKRAAQQFHLPAVAQLAAFPDSLFVLGSGSAQLRARTPMH